MPQPQTLRYFTPAGNPFGFGVTDFLALGVAALFVAVFLLRGRIVTAAEWLAARPVAAMAVAGLTPILLRLLLLGKHPMPTPSVADDFSYLLLGDTLAHFRLANPVHPMHRFFEGVFILQEPSYASNFPMGQGLPLALGQWLGNPWTGVLLSVGVLCAATTWMLRAWVSPVWALAGGMLAAIQFGPLSPWMNTYWGGAVSGIAGCLIFGALPRFAGEPRTRNGVLLGAGLGLQMLSRPYEFVLLLAGVALFRIPRRSLAVAALALLPAAGLTLLQNKAVTGNWTELPYVLSRYQYGIPTTFRFQPVPEPHRELTVEQRVDYETQKETHDRKAPVGERLPFLGFFFSVSLLVALPFFLRYVRETGFWQVAGVLATLWIGTGFYPYFYPHYIAAATCLFVLIAVKSLESLARVREEAAALVMTLCIAHFAFSYGIQAGGDPERPNTINERLAAAPGRQLVFVRYYPRHEAQGVPEDWIHNAANIDVARVVWALDLGPEEDAKLRRYFPDRTPWLLEPDARPPRLLPLVR